MYTYAGEAEAFAQSIAIQRIADATPYGHGKGHRRCDADQNPVNQPNHWRARLQAIVAANPYLWRGGILD
jgi:hypothetical protein